nr:hypothetical protein [Tanacetum cinerariifolium]
MKILVLGGFQRLKVLYVYRLPLMVCVHGLNRRTKEIKDFIALISRFTFTSCAISFANNKKRLLSTYGDGMIYHWDLRTMSCFHKGVDEGCITAEFNTTSAVCTYRHQFNGSQYKAFGFQKCVHSYQKRNRVSGNRKNARPCLLYQPALEINNCTTKNTMDGVTVPSRRNEQQHFEQRRYKLFIDPFPPMIVQEQRYTHEEQEQARIRWSLDSLLKVNPQNYQRPPYLKSMQQNNGSMNDDPLAKKSNARICRATMLRSWPMGCF